LILLLQAGQYRFNFPFWKQSLKKRSTGAKNMNIHFMIIEPN
jgi:hypothetical protein